MKVKLEKIAGEYARALLTQTKVNSAWKNFVAQLEKLILEELEEIKKRILNN